MEATETTSLAPATSHSRLPTSTVVSISRFHTRYTTFPELGDAGAALGTASHDADRSSHTETPADDTKKTADGVIGIKLHRRHALYCFDISVAAESLGAPHYTKRWHLRKQLSDFIRLSSAVTSELPLAPRFPLLVPQLHLLRDRFFRESVAVSLREYLCACVQLSGALADSPSLRDFLEIGGSSLDPRLMFKGKEGWLELITPSDGMLSSASCTPSCEMPCGDWRRKWCAIHESYFAVYDDIDAVAPEDVILFDRHLSLEIESHPVGFGTCGSALLCGAWSSIAERHALHLSLRTLQGVVHLRALGGRHVAADWVDAVRERVAHCEYVRLPPPSAALSTFAPLRAAWNSTAQWLVDGEAAYETIVAAIIGAKREILLSGW